MYHFLASGSQIEKRAVCTACSGSPSVDAKHRSFLSWPSQLWEKGQRLVLAHPRADFPKNLQGTSDLALSYFAGSFAVVVEDVLSEVAFGGVERGCATFGSITGLSFGSDLVEGTVVVTHQVSVVALDRLIAGVGIHSQVRL